MISPRLVRWLASQPGPVGAAVSAYQVWRWGDPYVRLVRFLCDRRRVSVDIGAHGGMYTWFIRRHSAGCISFEPNPRLAVALRRRFPRGVDVRNLALSDHVGRAVLRVPLRSAGPDPGRATIEPNNVLQDSQGVSETFEVDTVTLDQAVQQSVGFIKIDTEGHELTILRGAERILRHDQPNLILELDDHLNPGIIAATFAHLRERGYHGWFLDRTRVRSIDDLVPVQHTNAALPDTFVNNFVFSTDPQTGLRLHL
jgi:FkbM family methyltransferase